MKLEGFNLDIDKSLLRAPASSFTAKESMNALASYKGVSTSCLHTPHEIGNLSLIYIDVLVEARIKMHIFRLVVLRARHDPATGTKQYSPVFQGSALGDKTDGDNEGKSMEYI